ncbi:hypothetical protein EB821_00155 [Candidatus Marinimicrobia bacterium PRS2]|nr:hypothetical protein EB821_00155 [Candidatus Marinimicrobia bacterium PRS2]
MSAFAVSKKYNDEKMKYYKNILKYLILVMTLITSSLGQDLEEGDITVTLTLLNTSQFTLANWQTEENLWYVVIQNQTSLEQKYKIKYQLKKDTEILTWGLSPEEIIQSNETITIYNKDQLFSDPHYLEDWYGEGFTMDIEALGYIPPGSNYELRIEIVRSDDKNYIIDYSEEIMAVPLGDQFSIQSPNDGQVFPGGGNFYFQWDTPGFRQGVNIEFSIIISAIISEEVDSPEEAIETSYGSNFNSVFYFNSEWSELPIAGEWPYVELGNSKLLNFWYLTLISETGIDQLECGFDYAWRMDAREVIDGFESSSGDQGLWGWPEPVHSVVRKFTWGENPTGLISPVGDDVLPLFMWDNIGCAEDGFDIQISPIEDEDFAESWEADFISTPFQYPADAPGLIPGESYKWRGRVHSLTGGTNWSEPEEPEFFTIQDIELIEPQIGEIVESVRPYFNIDAPANISHYELLIGDKNDEYVEQVEVYNREEEITVLPWQYPSQNMENGLFPNMVYYWKLLMFDGSGNILGDIEDYEVMGNFRVMPIILTEPIHGGTNIPLDQKFTWDGPLSVPSYEFWLSDDQDPEVVNPKVIINITGSKSLYYPEDGDFPLENEKSYYWKIVPKDINDNYGLPSSYSMAYQFTALDFPVMGENVSVSSSDVRIPIINIETSEGLEYTIFIYEDADGSIIIEELPGITNFPYEYSDGKETLQYGTTYYIQVQPMKNGENFGPPSNMLPFSIPEEPENTEQCEISCELTDSDESEILISILTGIEEATEYLILVSQNEDMSNPIEFIISSSESQYLLTSEHVNWGQTYYTQVIARSADGEIIGIASEIQIIYVESKPGTNEQTAIAVSLQEGSTNPIFEIINDITGATGYQITLSTESDMSVELYQFTISNSLTADYPSDGPQLQYGKSYYVTAQGLDDDNTHGITSSVVGFFIPNITPPILGEPFSWEASIPAANQYRLEVSLIEDFSALVLNNTTDGTTFPMNMDELELSKGYYWKVQGLDEDGNLFGNSSQISFFQTQSVPAPTLNVFSAETPLTPEFSWSGIEMATGYQITVASDGGLENILWQENTNNTSATYPESATLLEFASTYFWQVASLGENDVALSLSSIESFSTKSVYPVMGLNPDGGTEMLSPALQWEANDKITTYLVNVGTDAEISSVIVNEQTDGNSIQVDEGVLSSGNSYYWIVDGLDENGESLAGPSNSAMIVMPSTDNIPLISPIGDEQVSNLNPVLKWGSLLGTTSYTLRVGADPEFENLLINTIVSDNEITISEENRLNNSITYFWQIEGATETAVIISNTGSFVTPSFVELSIQELEDEVVISVTNPSFSWEAGEGISAFSIRFSDKSDFSVGWNFQIGATNFQYPGEPPLTFDIPYYWQVSPLNNEGSPIGGWTSSRSFSISAAYIVELELPGNGEVATTSKPKFQWGVIEGAAKYEIQVSNLEDFSEIMWSSAEIIENSTPYPGSGSEPLNYGQTYFWHVRALGEEATLGDYSTAFSFYLSGENKVELEGPLDEESESLFPYFSWIPVNVASAYSLTLASDESISTIIYSADATEVFYQYPQAAPPLGNGVTLYWKVIAKDENGSPVGDASNVGSFSSPSGTIEIEFMFGDE